MPRPPSSQPTEVELQILRILWEQGPSTARQIHNRLAGVRDTNYSTTVKMLAVSRDKGLVKRDENATPHIYRAGITRKRAQKRMLDDLIWKVYDGSTSSLVLHALSSKAASPEDIDEIQRLLGKMREDHRP